jgi:uncharacterized membrane protein YedE/YeeE
MSTRLVGALTGVAFGFVLCWSDMVDPNVIRGALLLDQSYLFLFFASAVIVAAAGVELLRRRQAHALITGAPITWVRERPQRRHIVGSAIFGVGWATADACPGPVAAQVGQGIAWALPLLAGILIGVWLFIRGGARETEPAADPPAGLDAIPSPPQGAHATS